MKTTLTSFLAGALLVVGSAMAAQTSPKPAAKTSTASKTTSTKKVAHNKKKHSKATKSVAKKNAAPVTPVAAKK